MPGIREKSQRTAKETRAMAKEKSTETEQPAATPNKVLVHAINVSQGDAILLEVQHTDGTSRKRLIDGGPGTEKTKAQPKLNPYRNLEKCITKTTAPKDKGTTLKDLECDPRKLDSIVVTHPDADHYGGINKLLQNYDIDGPIITSSASYFHTRKGNQEGKKYSETGHWFQNNAQGKIHKHIRNLTERSIIKKPNFKGVNASSILTTVHLPGSSYDYDVVLTGDSSGSIILKTLDLVGKSVGIFQVPHHGSRYNSVVSGGPSIPASTTFFRRFQAKIYLISHGHHKGYNHPHTEVVTGVLVAAAIEKHHCKLVLTSSRFDESKIRYPSDEKIHQDWRSYVQIYHFKEGASYVTLDPHFTEEGSDVTLDPAEIDSISKVNGLERWTGEEGGQVEQTTTTAEQVLTRKLMKKNLQREEVCANGNCFFEAVSQALNQQDDENLHFTREKLRQNLVHYLLDNRKRYRKYCTLLQDGHFTKDIGDLMPYAIANQLRIRIDIITSNAGQQDDLQCVPDDRKYTTQIQLAYNAAGPGHYDFAVANTTREEATPPQSPSRLGRPSMTQTSTDNPAKRRLRFPESSDQPSEPSEQAGDQPSEPSEQAGDQPSEPSEQAGEQPSEQAGEQPSEPSEQAGEQPSEQAGEQPSEPSEQAGEQPSEQAGDQPSEPSEQAGDQPSEPSEQAGDQPSEPSEQAGEQPSEQAGDQPSEPSEQAGEQPSEQAGDQPSEVKTKTTTACEQPKCSLCNKEIGKSTKKNLECNNKKCAVKVHALCACPSKTEKGASRMKSFRCEECETCTVCDKTIKAHTYTCKTCGTSAHARCIKTKPKSEYICTKCPQR